MNQKTIPTKSKVNRIVLKQIWGKMNQNRKGKMEEGRGERKSERGLRMGVNREGTKGREGGDKG